MAANLLRSVCDTCLHHLDGFTADVRLLSGFAVVCYAVNGETLQLQETNLCHVVRNNLRNKRIPAVVDSSGCRQLKSEIVCMQTTPLVAGLAIGAAAYAGRALIQVGSKWQAAGSAVGRSFYKVRFFLFCCRPGSPGSPHYICRTVSSCAD